MRYVAFSKNYVYNYSFLAEYYKDYDSFVEHRSLTIGLLTMLSVCIMIGPLGNIAIIGAIYTNKVLWKPLNLFIINLSLADLVIVTFISATSITGLMIGHQVFLQNHSLCNFVANVCLTACVAQLLTHAVIAITRYISIRYPTTFINNATWKSTSIACALIWIIAFMLQFPPDVGWGRNVLDLKAMICIWDRTYSIGYTLYFAIVYVFIPMSSIFFCYVMLYLHIRKIRRNIDSQSKNDLFKIYTSMSRKRWKQEIKLAKTLCAHFAIVFILWGQYAFIVIFDYRNRLPTVVHAISIQVAHSIAVVNVFVYIFNRSFQDGMIAFLTRKSMRLILSGTGTTEVAATSITKSETKTKFFNNTVKPIKKSTSNGHSKDSNLQL
ncbi:unnamed protein product [Gordionus sp. m RMFG-2023]|uniref:alpha-1A adrenergic receptor-like n=1 Tax=Gordionus sp. m RMFG-2023 TaxID=3053472 RepID=UPI0030E2E307